MSDLERLFERIDALLDQPALPPLDSSILGERPPGMWVDEAWPEYHPEPLAEKPRPRPPRPFPVSESDALARRAEPVDARPRPWFGRWRRG